MMERHVGVIREQDRVIFSEDVFLIYRIVTQTCGQEGRSQIVTVVTWLGVLRDRWIGLK